MRRIDVEIFRRLTWDVFFGESGPNGSVFRPVFASEQIYWNFPDQSSRSSYLEWNESGWVIVFFLSHERGLNDSPYIVDDTIGDVYFSQKVTLRFQRISNLIHTDFFGGEMAIHVSDLIIDRQSRK